MRIRRIRIRTRIRNTATGDGIIKCYESARNLSGNESGSGIGTRPTYSLIFAIFRKKSKSIPVIVGIVIFASYRQYLL